MKEKNSVDKVEAKRLKPLLVFIHCWRKIHSSAGRYANNSPVLSFLSLRFCSSPIPATVEQLHSGGKGALYLDGGLPVDKPDGNQAQTEDQDPDQHEGPAQS